MYRILHTADWHLGQTFKNKTRIEEHQLFIHWLLQTISAEHIQAVLIAGDVFDVFNPSIEALDLYHQFLTRAYQLGVQVVIIGGNHDSAARLNSTSGLLQCLNVQVVGGDTNALGKVVPLTNQQQEIVAAVVAIPYLRDGDVRQLGMGEGVTEAHQLFAQSVGAHYHQLLLEAKQQYPHLPILGMAHLYITGSTTSDASSSTPMHQIGTLATISASRFPGTFAYLALGHIHKPQVLQHPENTIVKYAGSPIPLSFSERADNKEITLITIAPEQQLQYTAIPVPLARPLLRFKGSSDDILNAIAAYQPHTDLPAWAEIIITEPTDFVAFNTLLSSLAEEKNMEILERTVQLSTSAPTNTREAFVADFDNNPLEDVTAIFKLRCEKSGLNNAAIAQLLPLFQETLQLVQTAEQTTPSR